MIYINPPAERLHFHIFWKCGVNTTKSSCISASPLDFSSSESKFHYLQSTIPVLWMYVLAKSHEMPKTIQNGN